MEKHSLYEVIFKLKPLPKKLTERSYVDALITAIDERLTITEHRYRSLLLNAGHRSDYMYFVEKGIARCFHLTIVAEGNLLPFFGKNRVLFVIR
ncbi:hypothetical protein LH29_10690 [Draconibacterium sediminis]|uniref:Cyclic nucleotide-binding domain-containing protein n=1 Tax=Draconibacterium sediminis TaxID=1544798 RepID=A0A0D8JAM6_9BACT|nr:hypothetical protein LH29_10690 [Draconibacterium sediminis]